MSLKHILGTMLATRMAGRGRRRGSLGTAAMLGGLGRRRRPMGGKLGLATLDYMAYRAYQDHQARSGGPLSPVRSTPLDHTADPCPGYISRKNKRWPPRPARGR